MNHYESSVEAYRADALTAAKELCYGDEVIRRLRNAKTEGEIERIMVTARKSRK